MDRSHALPAIAIVITTALAGGCSSRQVYQSGQNWQRLECQKIQDTADRDKCLSDASTSYEDYKRRSEAAKSSR